jgi:phosphoribosylaminoimidazolecarboxamide formyltransferase/IMP cyclohydrolase
MSRIQRALLSVSDKTGLLEFAKALLAHKVQLLSTGGTAKLLRDAGLAVTDVSEHTGFPEMLDGRVKTLHPKIHGGLLGIRNDPGHKNAMQEHAIAPIDLVVVNLYPFEETVAKGAGFAECIENIDIGGPAMIRSAAKNHADVTVIVDAADYASVIDEMRAHEGATLPETRKKLAAKAYARTASYDAAISRWFAGQLQEPFPETFTLAAKRKQSLAYGENPHQQAAFYITDPSRKSVANAVQLQGKALSYNNINDADGAWELVSEFRDGPAVAIIKHANPCGVAAADSLKEAYLRALACDPVSAYGGIVALNKPLDEATAEEIARLFVEVIVAPEISPEARALLSKKQKLRVLATGGMPDPQAPEMMLKSVSGGLLLQSRDNTVFDAASVRIVTKRRPSAQELDDLRMALTVAKHVKSNAVVLAREGRTIGIGAGQMSRVDSVRIAVRKAADAKLETQGCALASEAFFPFDDNVHHAAKAGITSIIQPGGSIRDEEVIKAADQYDMAMVFTGVRHFRH